MSAFLALIYSTQVERKEVPYLAINRNQHVLLACLNSGLSELNLDAIYMHSRCNIYSAILPILCNLHPPNDPKNPLDLHKMFTLPSDNYPNSNG
jgi:hypothetical protein